MDSNWNCCYMAMLLQSAQAESRCEDVANERISRVQRSLAGFSNCPKFIEDRKRVDNEGNCLIVLEMSGIAATQKRDPKQTHASEGAIKICANH